MKKLIIYLNIFVLLFSSQICVAYSEAPAISAQSAVLINASDGQVLYEKDPDERMLIASTTKIMTALVVLENCDLNETVTVKREWTGVEGSSMYLKPGEKISVEDLLYGMMLTSGNDAAVALACFTAGDILSFAELMNKKVDELGLKNTCFKNPHGLDEDGHFSTASDLAQITAEAIKNEDFCKIVSTKAITVGERTLVNHNKLLWKDKSMIGVKTGYTISSGRSLVSCMEKHGLRLVFVTLNDSDDWDDHMSMYNWAFSEHKNCSLTCDDVCDVSIPVISGDNKELGLKLKEEYSKLIDTDDKVEIRLEAPKFLYAPVNQGQSVGKASVLINNNTEFVTELLCDEESHLDEGERLSGMQKFIKSLQIELSD